MSSQLPTSPREYFPSIYDRVLEIDELSKVENKLFAVALEKMNQVWSNQFIATSDISGIETYEKMLGIIANPATENLEFRRSRIANRFSMSPPFTMPWLRLKFDELFGVGNWSANVDFATRTLSVEAVVSDEAWAQEVSVTITQIKPANMVFISKPRLPQRIVVGEQIESAKRVNNYRLGVSWFLGSTPFSSLLNSEVIKVASVSSIKEGMLNALAAFAADEVVSVRINDTLEIPSTEFTSATSEGNVTTIEYRVPSSQLSDPITNIKLYGSNSTLLAEATVYIDSTYDVSLKHTFTFKEGA